MLDPSPGQAGDDDAGVHAPRPYVEAGDDALDAAPAVGGIMEFTEAPDLLRPLGPGGSVRPQRGNMRPQGRVGVQTQGKSTPIVR